MQPDAGWVPTMAVGPWHARAHIAACQEKFGARAAPGSGLSFGDNTERLWAARRPYAYMQKRMAAARRRDQLLLLVRGLPCSSRTRMICQHALILTMTSMENSASRQAPDVVINAAASGHLLLLADPLLVHTRSCFGNGSEVVLRPASDCGRCGTVML